MNKYEEMVFPRPWWELDPSRRGCERGHMPRLSGKSPQQGRVLHRKWTPEEMQLWLEVLPGAEKGSETPWRLPLIFHQCLSFSDLSQNLVDKGT